MPKEKRASSIGSATVRGSLHNPLVLHPVLDASWPSHGISKAHILKKAKKQLRGPNEEATRPEPLQSRPASHFLVTFEGLVEAPDLDEAIEAHEREVEIIRSSVLC